MIRLLIACLASALLTGCMSFNGQVLANRVAVPLAMDECRVDSRWGPFGISTDLDKRDCEVIREALRLKALQDLIRSQQAPEKVKAPGVPILGPSLSGATSPLSAHP